VTLEVYDWTTGKLLSSWPVAIPQYAGEVRLAVYGHLAAVEGRTGCTSSTWTPARMSRSRARAVPTARRRSIPAASSTVNPHYNGPGRLVFVPTARLLVLAS